MGCLYPHATLFNPSGGGTIISAYEVPGQLSVEYLLSGVKQLSHPELREFIEKLTEWQKQRKAAKESELLGVIQANSQLPEKEHRRYRELWRKCEDGTLSEVERVEYQALLNQLEVRNAKRIEALILLAQLRGKTLPEVTTEVGTKEGSVRSEHIPAALRWRVQ